MNIRDAVRQSQKLVDSGELEAVDAVAVHCLIELAKKVVRVQRPLRQLERAVCPREDLNQVSIFDEQASDPE